MSSWAALMVHTQRPSEEWSHGHSYQLLPLSRGQGRKQLVEVGQKEGRPLLAFLSGQLTLALLGPL